MSGKPTVATVPPRATARLAVIVILNKVKSTFQRGDVYRICENEISYSDAILVSNYGRGRSLCQCRSLSWRKSDTGSVFRKNVETLNVSVFVSVSLIAFAKPLFHFRHESALRICK